MGMLPSGAKWRTRSVRSGREETPPVAMRIGGKDQGVMTIVEIGRGARTGKSGMAVQRISCRAGIGAGLTTVNQGA